MQAEVIGEGCPAERRAGAKALSKSASGVLEARQGGRGRSRGDLEVAGRPGPHRLLEGL